MLDSKREIAYNYIIEMNSEGIKYTPKRDRISLDLIYHEVARRYLLHQSQEDIVAKTGISKGTLQAMTRRPQFIKIMNELKEKAFAGVDVSIISEKRNMRAEIMEAAEDSFDALTDLLKSAAAETTVVKVAQDFMDRAGGDFAKQPEEIKQPMININIVDAEVLTDALQREKKGRERLEELGAIELAKDPDKLEHPLLKKPEDGNEQNSKPAE